MSLYRVAQASIRRWPDRAVLVVGLVLSMLVYCFAGDQVVNDRRQCVAAQADQAARILRQRLFGHDDETFVRSVGASDGVADGRQSATSLETVTTVTLEDQLRTICTANNIEAGVRLRRLDDDHGPEALSAASVSTNAIQYNSTPDVVAQSVIVLGGRPWLVCWTLPARPLVAAVSNASSSYLAVGIGLSLLLFCMKRKFWPARHRAPGSTEGAVMEGMRLMGQEGLRHGHAQ
jgi:CHASE1-domain containing sensor protein